MVHVIDAVLKPPELDPIVNRSCPITNEDTLPVSSFGIIIYNMFTGSFSFPVGIV